jgi:hypothetical protein
MAGRPRALDDTKRREVCALISAGCGIAAAAKFVGCNPVTIRRESMRNADFFEDLRKAELAAQALPLQAIRKAASTHWRAAAWFLERTQPLVFGRRRPTTFAENDIRAALELVHEVMQAELPNAAAQRRVWDTLDAIHADLMAEHRASESPRPDVHARRLRQKLARQGLAPHTTDSRFPNAGIDFDGAAGPTPGAWESSPTDAGETT